MVIDFKKLKSNRPQPKRGKTQFLLRLLLWWVGIAGLGVAWYFNDFEVELEKTIVYFIFLWTISLGIKEENIYNPYFLFSLLPISLLIYDETISRTYLVELFEYTYIFAIINMLVFLITMKYTYGYSKRVEVGLETNEKLLKHGWIMFGISLLAYVITPFSTFLDVFKFMAIACAVKAKRYASAVVMILIVLFLNQDTLNKTNILCIILLLILCYFKYTGKKGLSFKMVLFIALAAFIMVHMFTLKSYIVNGGTVWEYITDGYKNNDIRGYYTERPDVNWNGPEWLFTPWMYLTTPWTNLQLVIFTQRDYTYGLWMLKPVINWLQMDGVLESFYELKSYSTFNTFTYLGVLFKDFGYIGSCFGSVVIAVFVKRIYNRFMNSDSPLDIASYALIAQATAELFFSNHFFTQSYPFVIVMMVALYRLILRIIDRRTRNREIE